MYFVVIKKVEQWFLLPFKMSKIELFSNTLLVLVGVVPSSAAVTPILGLLHLFNRNRNGNGSCDDCKRL